MFHLEKEENDGMDEIALYICAGEISSRDTNERSQGLLKAKLCLLRL